MSTSPDAVLVTRLDDGLQATASGPKPDPSQRQVTYTSLAFGNRATELGIIRSLRIRR
jgi:hypothetical protein